MQLSPHFARSEFERHGQMPDDCIVMLTDLCLFVLEPTRAYFGDKPMRITSGYRSPEYNASVNGSSTSQHVYSPDACACDFQIPGVPLITVFDWLRLKSGLTFDQLILERGREPRHENDDCIHISLSRTPRLMAMEGSVNNASGYTPKSVARPEEWIV